MATAIAPGVHCIEEQYDIKPLEIGGPCGAFYLPYMVLHHTAWSTQKGVSTSQGLGA